MREMVDSVSSKKWRPPTRPAPSPPGRGLDAGKGVEELVVPLPPPPPIPVDKEQKPPPLPERPGRKSAPPAVGRREAGWKERRKSEVIEKPADRDAEAKQQRRATVEHGRAVGKGQANGVRGREPRASSTRTIIEKKLYNVVKTSGLEIDIKDVKYHSIKDKIGSGSFGDVYRVRLSTQNNRVVAMKHFRKDILMTAIELKGFGREIELLSKLKHPCIVQLVGVCLKPGNLAIFTEFMKGRSLFDILHVKRKHFNFAWKAMVMEQIASGLTYLHSHKPPVLHRDIKSANVLLDATNNAKITDFGCSRFMMSSETTLTRYVGSPRWTAPEILRGASTYSDKADVYSLGLVFYEVLFCKLPYPYYNMHELRRKVAIEGSRPELPKDLNSKLARVLTMCWAQSPSKRPSVRAALIEVKAAWDEILSDRRISQDVSRSKQKEMYENDIHHHHGSDNDSDLSDVEDEHGYDTSDSDDDDVDDDEDANTFHSNIEHHTDDDGTTAVAIPQSSIHKPPIARKCTICFSSDIDCIFQSCGHSLSCYNCAILLRDLKKTCPLCKASIIDARKGIFNQTSNGLQIESPCLSPSISPCLSPK